MDIEQTLKYGSEGHNKVLEEICLRMEMSERHMSDQHKKWQKADEAAIAYIPERAVDVAKNTRREVEGIQDYTQIYVPYDYGVVASAHTYLTGVFLGRNPVLQYMSRDGSKETATQALEALTDYQVRVGKHLVPLYLWLHDMCKYGIGIIGAYWEDAEEWVALQQIVKEVALGVETGRTRLEWVEQKLEGYKGTKIWNVRPYDFLPDPRKHFRDMQSGEFCGCIKEGLHYNDILRYQETDYYFNVEELQALLESGGGENPTRGGSSVVSAPLQPGANMAHKTIGRGTVRAVDWVQSLVPSEWGLGQSKRLQKWVFRVADEKIIYDAKPLGELHNKYPYLLGELEQDSEPFFKRGFYAQAEPLNKILNWLVNTHFHSVRKTVNDTLVYDPSRVSSNDVTNSASRIRLLPAAYGTDPAQAIKQLPVGTVTNQHVADISLVQRFGQFALGINEQMGGGGSSGRKSATEVRTTSTFGVNRLKSMAEFISAQAFSEYGDMVLQLSQQHYEGEMKLRLAGNLVGRENANKLLAVTPRDIAGKYDFVSFDGTLPVDRFAMVNMWAQLFQVAQMMPQVLQRYDLGLVFGHIMQLGGIKNLKEFEVQVLPPGAGPPPGTVPVGGANGQGRAVSRAGGNGGSPPPPQVPGMGPSG